MTIDAKNKADEEIFRNHLCVCDSVDYHISKHEFLKAAQEIRNAAMRLVDSIKKCSKCTKPNNVYCIRKTQHVYTISYDKFRRLR